jgi:hypothetical protein
MPGFWRKCRITFRWLRFTAWFVVLVLLGSLAWFNLVGLPDLLKVRLVATLHERGVDLEFSRMRLRFVHGFVMENVRIGHASDSARPSFTAGEVQLRLDYSALLHRRFQLDGLVLRNGKFALPLSATNTLALFNLQTQLHFEPDDTWSLDHFSADFAGSKILLTGQVAHAPEVLNWKTFAGETSGGPGALKEPLQQFSDTLARIRFTGPPQVSVRLDGDARDIHSFTLRLNASAPGVVTPWFSARELQAVANLTAPADAPTNFDAALGFWTNAQPFRLAWIVRAKDLKSEKINVDGAEMNGLWQAPDLAVTKFFAQLGGGSLSAAAQLDVKTRGLAFTNASSFDPHLLADWLPENWRGPLAEISWAQPPVLDADGSVTLPSWTNNASDWGDAVRTTLRLRGALAFTNAVVRGAPVDLAQAHFSRADRLWSMADLELVQGRTQLRLDGQISEATENFACRAAGTVDADSVRPFLTATNAVRGFELFQFNEPLALAASASGNLRNLDTTSATGRVALTNFTVRGQSADSVAADVNYTNRVLEFLSPQFFRAGGSQTLTADAVALDFNRRMIFFTNGFSTAEPMMACRAIGPKTAKIIEPYEFLKPPTVRVHGQLPLRDINSGHDLDGTDMTFDIVRGAPFRWTKIQSTNITGTVHWLGQSLVLTNIAAAVYGGTGEGYASFDFRPVGYGCNFNFGVAVTNVNVHLLAADLSAFSTNALEGILNARAVVTDGNSKTWRSWNGYGTAQLADGLLWNIPIFGILSPVLNTVTPGLGNSRATEASAAFAMTNGVIYSDSVEIHTLTMRLHYTGSLDLEQNVDARVTAQLMRNMPVLGSLVSTVLYPVSKIFECQVNGRISDPKVTPVLFPFSKYLLVPLHPVRSFQELFPLDDKPSG